MKYHTPSPYVKAVRIAGRRPGRPTTSRLYLPLMPAHIVSLNRSRGGVPKLPVDAALVSPAGLEGDKQYDRRYHGGLLRALCLYSLELIEQLRAEGHPIVPGAAGENVTIAGMDWHRMTPGARVLLGNVEIVLTTYTSPCKTIRRAFVNEDFSRISEKLHPGWSRIYARVPVGGELRVGAEVTIATA